MVVNENAEGEIPSYTKGEMMKNKFKVKIAMVLALSIFAGAAYAMICVRVGDYCDYDNGCMPYYRCGPNR